MKNLLPQKDTPIDQSCARWFLTKINYFLLLMTLFILSNIESHAQQKAYSSFLPIEEKVGARLQINIKDKKQLSEVRPNIIIIMADDLGFSDIGCYGGEIETPNLDWLAKNGMRFNSFYNASRCCPTRASLLTGLYPHQAGIGRMTMNQKLPGYRGFLTKNTVTIAEVLKKYGYQTGMVGKWHISETKSKAPHEQLKWLAHQQEFGDFSDTLTYPTHRGFDKFYGTIWGVVDYFDPFSIVNGTKPVKLVPKDFYYPNAIGDSSVSYINQFNKSKSPFFLYVAFTSPHWPLQALPEDIKKYKNTYEKGWEYIIQTRFERMNKMGLFKGYKISLPDFMYPELNWQTNKSKVWDAKAMAVHAAMVDNMDKNIGKLITILKEIDQLDNTLIMFLSDNGASAEDPALYGPGFDRAGSTRDGKAVIFPTNKEVLPGSQTVHAGIGAQWANTANTPFRYWKSKEHEGGISTPFIAFWPKKINRINTINSTPTHIIDLMSTCLAVSGGKYPSQYKDHQITPTPGTSLVPVFIKDSSGQIHKELFWEHFGAAALRQGDYKIVKIDNKSDWELYNLKTDRSEIHNLANKNPAILKSLIHRWENLASVYKVYPKPLSN